MFDRELVHSLMKQVCDWLITIQQRSEGLHGPDDFVNTEEGKQKFDSICMLFIAAGESIKRADQITDGELFAHYPKADWHGAMGFRDVIAHQYFQIDPEEVYSIIEDDLDILIEAVKSVVSELE